MEFYCGFYGGGGGCCCFSTRSYNNWTILGDFVVAVAGQCHYQVLWKVNLKATNPPGQCPYTQVAYHHNNIL